MVAIQEVFWIFRERTLDLCGRSQRHEYRLEIPSLEDLEEGFIGRRKGMHDVRQPGPLIQRVVLEATPDGSARSIANQERTARSVRQAPGLRLAGPTVVALTV